ncbi:MAG: type II secretion system protein [Limisphaerales bacterium]
MKPHRITTEQGPRSARVFERSVTAGAFSLIELLVVITIIAILAGLLVPAISRGKADAKQAVCLSNQGQMVKALMMYADNDSKQSFGGTDVRRQSYPMVNENWLRNSENLSVKIFFCPATKNGEFAANRVGKEDNQIFYYNLLVPAEGANATMGYSYDPILWFADMEDFWNGNRDSNKNSRFVTKTLANIVNFAHANEAFGMRGKQFGASRTWLLTDNDDWGHDNKFWPEPNNNHGAAGANTAFADGHAAWIPRLNYVYQYEASQDNNRTRATPRPNL